MREIPRRIQTRRCAPGRLALSVIVFLLGSGPLAGAQPSDQSESPSRAALLEAQRQARLATISPPQKSGIERALDWYDNQYILTKFFSGWHGFHMAGGSFPAGAGLKFGAGFTQRALGSRYVDANQPNRVDLNAVAATSTRGYHRVRGEVGFLNVGGAPVDVNVLGQYYEFPQEDFFGLGPGSRKADRTNYRLNSSEVGVDVAFRPGGGLEVMGGWSWLTPDIGTGTDRRFLSIDQRFEAAEIPGFLAQPNFVRAAVAVEFDARDNPSLPRAGGLYRVSVADFRDLDLARFDFRRVDAELQQYIPLPDQYRTLALRAVVVVTETEAGQDVPFYYAPTLGGATHLRGFREFRFRDRNSLLLSAEYRWQAWWAMTPALFVDAGKIAHDRADLDFRNLEVSYGLGFRLHSNSAFTARLDLTFSREGFIPLLRFEHAF